MLAEVTLDGQLDMEKDAPLSLVHASTVTQSHETTNDQRMTTSLARPFLKWAGGKGQLLPQFHALFPRTFANYHEPFVGGGAVFFALAPRLAGKKVFLSDNNDELMNAYRVVRDAVEPLITSLSKHRNDETYYYQVRDYDPNTLTDVERASRLIFLNRTCFNGLYRVNRRGKFNVPFGRYRNPLICDEVNLRACSEALTGVEIVLGTFTDVLLRAQAGDFVYFDPPYLPLSKTSSFTDYTKYPFGIQEHQQLAQTYTDLSAKGVKVMLSNSDVNAVWDLYKDFDIRRVTATRAINSKADGRGPITEVVVLNYDPRG